MDLDRFDLIDSVACVGCDQGSIVCRTRLPDKAILYEGHFPGYPLVPATVQTEIMAQAAGLLSLIRTQNTRMPFLIGIENARFRKELRPGSEIMISAVCSYDNDRMMTADCLITHNNERLSEAHIRLTLSKFPTAELKAHVDGLVARTQGMIHT